jgi:DNA-binding MarR family transcriptional regulator
MSHESMDAALELPFLAPVEEAVYAALHARTSASHPSLTLSEIVAATGLSEGDVQRACRKLADAGLVAIDGVTLSPLRR